MSNGYESTEAFLSGIERELKGSIESNVGGARGPERSSGRDYDRGERSHHNSSRVGGDSRGGRYEEDDRARRRREYGGDGDRYAPSSSRRDYDYDRHGGGQSDHRRRHDDYGRGGGDRDGGYRRHQHGGGGYGHDAPRGGDYRDDRRYEDRNRRYDDHRGRGSGGGGGGGGGWRDGPAREPSPSVRRSPTPPGTRPISERVRKNSKWNIAPSGFENMSPMQAKATGIFGIPGQSRTLGVPGPSLMRDANGNLVVPSGIRPAEADEATGTSTSATQNNRQARRLYVGNIGYNANEQNLCAFFNEQMHKMKFTTEDGDPALSAQVNTEKGYAFVEFRSTGEATNAMSFDGIVFHGQSIKIRRPKDYVGPDTLPPQALHVPGVISTNVPDGPNKIYIGGLPTYLNEDQIIELLKSFGELRSFNLVRESGVNGASKGFAFCEYVDASITDLAIQGLNDMELADKRLMVQRASVGNAGPRRDGGLPPSTGANSAPLAAGGIGAGGPGEPTKAMMLFNCVTAEELVDAEEYKEIVEDMRDECARYGRVVDMRIPRPQTASKGSAAQTWKQTKNGEPIEDEAADKAATTSEREGVGRVYVLFDEPAACQRALQAIAGRQFAGRTVIAAFIEEDSFPSDEDGGRDAEETSKQATGDA